MGRDSRKPAETVASRRRREECLLKLAMQFFRRKLLLKLGFPGKLAGFLSRKQGV